MFKELKGDGMRVAGYGLRVPGFQSLNSSIPQFVFNLKPLITKTRKDESTKKAFAFSPIPVSPFQQFQPLRSSVFCRIAVPALAAI